MSHDTAHTLGLRQLFALLVAVVMLLVALSFFGESAQGPFASSELKFTDTSGSGLDIMPASCPSSPHYAGECGIVGGGDEPPSVSGNACVIGLSPSTIVTGGSSIMAWNSSFSIFGVPLSLTGSISPAPGGVSSSGVTTVSPTVTTTYTGTFTPSVSDAQGGIPASWLVPVTCSTLLTVLQAAPDPTNCSVQNFCVGSSVYRQNANCTNTLVQTCTFGCSNGVCLGAPIPVGYLRARPELVRAGDPTIVEWSSAQVSSCSVTGTNGDSWTGTSGSQTSSAITSQVTYTLSCLGLDTSTIERTTVVNITPIFDEQ